MFWCVVHTLQINRKIHSSFSYLILIIKFLFTNNIPLWRLYCHNWRNFFHTCFVNIFPIWLLYFVVLNWTSVDIVSIAVLRCILLCCRWTADGWFLYYEQLSCLLKGRKFVSLLTLRLLASLSTECVLALV